MKAYFKNVLRSMRGNVGKLISLTLIATVGVAFVAGLGTLSPTIEASYSEAYRQGHVPDIIVKATDLAGLSDDDIEAITSLPDVVLSSALTSVDMPITLPRTEQEINTRIYVVPDEIPEVNVLTLEDGSWPDEAMEIMVERHNETLTAHSVGDEINVDIPLDIFGETLDITFTLTVSGIVANPMILLKTGEPMLTDPEKTLNDIIYVTRSSFPSFIQSLYRVIPITDLYLQVSTAPGASTTYSDLTLSYYSSEYLDRVNEVKEAIENLGIEDIQCLTLEQNASYMTLGG